MSEIGENSATMHDMSSIGTSSLSTTETHLSLASSASNLAIELLLVFGESSEDC